MFNDYFEEKPVSFVSIEKQKIDLGVPQTELIFNHGIYVISSDDDNSSGHTSK